MALRMTIYQAAACRVLRLPQIGPFHLAQWTCASERRTRCVRDLDRDQRPHPSTLTVAPRTSCCGCPRHPRPHRLLRHRHRHPSQCRQLSRCWSRWPHREALEHFHGPPPSNHLRLALPYTRADPQSLTMASSRARVWRAGCRADLEVESQT